MELGFTPKTVQYLKQVLCTGLSKEETMDTIVPDSCPDVARIVGAYAVPSVRSKECRQGSVTVTGGIRATAIYVGEGESVPRSLEMYLPFTVKAENPELTEQTTVQCRVFVRSADARPVNSRKVMMRVNLCAELRGYETAAETFSELTEVPAGLQAHTAEYELVLPTDAAERSFQITEELHLPQNKPLVGDVFCFRPSLEITEKRLVGNKVVFKGLARLRLLYATDNGAMAAYDSEIPFSQYCELQDLYEDEEVNVIPLLTGCDLDRTMRQEGDGLLVTLHILAQCAVSCRQKVLLCDDAYALKGTFSPKWEKHTMQNRLDRRTLPATLRESWSGEVSDVLDVCVHTDLPRIRAVEEGTEIAVPLAAQILYLDRQGELQGTTLRAEQKQVLPMAENAVCRATAAVTGDAVALPTGDGLELRCPLLVDASTMAQGEFSGICGGTVAESETPITRRPAVVVRRMQGGERLWDIAKASGTTVDRIRCANALTSETAEAGVLLIPI